MKFKHPSKMGRTVNRLIHHGWHERIDTLRGVILESKKNDTADCEMFATKDFVEYTYVAAAIGWSIVRNHDDPVLKPETVRKQFEKRSKRLYDTA